MQIRLRSFPDEVMRAAQLAGALEVSGWPKPGNVHRVADFADTRFEQFLAGSIALGPAVRRAAKRGVLEASGKISMEELGLGNCIKKAVSDVRSWHRGGNTHLGVSLLFIPLAASAGLTFASSGKLTIRSLRKNVAKVVRATTTKDTLDVYRAIRLAKPAGLGELESLMAPSLNEKNAESRIAKEGITLFAVMKTSAEWDNIAREWTSDMRITFEIGCPTFIKTYRDTGEVNTATVHTFLTILDRVPDTFIARKVGTRFTKDIRHATKIGLKEARRVSSRASQVLKAGGLLTLNGQRELKAFDKELRTAGNELNPGTTADLTASSLLTAILCGVRP